MIIIIGTKKRITFCPKMDPVVSFGTRPESVPRLPDRMGMAVEFDPFILVRPYKPDISFWSPAAPSLGG